MQLLEEIHRRTLEVASDDSPRDKNIGFDAPKGPPPEVKRDDHGHWYVYDEEKKQWFPGKSNEPVSNRYPFHEPALCNSGVIFEYDD